MQDFCLHPRQRDFEGARTGGVESCRHMPGHLRKTATANSGVSRLLGTSRSDEETPNGVVDELRAVSEKQSSGLRFSASSRGQRLQRLNDASTLETGRCSSGPLVRA
jgi:hypothetical protein